MSDNNDSLPFSKRYSYTPVDLPFQTDSIDYTLRIELWNGFYLFLIQPYYKAELPLKSRLSVALHSIWMHFFRQAIDEFPGIERFQVYIKKWIFEESWYRIYDLFEFILKNIEGSRYHKDEGLIEFLETKLRQNNAGYSIIERRFIPVVSQAEIHEIKATQRTAAQYGLGGVQEHLKSAIELLSKKPEPDYRNSIKESISMVEAICRLIEPENTLGKALTKLAKGQMINSTLIAGFEKLYAYTNNNGGIRHALMDQEEISLEDAKYFLVSCSAFANYLIEKAKKQGAL